MISSSEDKNNNNSSARRSSYWIVFFLCLVAVEFVVRSTPRAAPSEPCREITIDEKVANSIDEKVPIAPQQLSATPLPEIDAYVAEVNARKTQQPKFWSFPGKAEKYDMNKYNFKFDPEKPTCPEPALRPQEGASNCPDEDIYLAVWMLIRDHRRPENRGRPLTLVDVGSNKGFSVAGMIEALNLTVPEQTTDVDDIHYVDPAYLRSRGVSTFTNNDVPGYFSREALGLDVYTYAEKLNLLPPGHRGSLAGACCDISSKSPFHPDDVLAKHRWLVPSEISGGLRRGNVYVPEVEAFLIDGTRSHVDYVTQFFNKENKYYESQVMAKYNKEKQPLQLPPTKFSFHYFQRAMSNRKGTTKFCDVPFGMEHAAICDSGNGIATPITTLDLLIPSHVQKIDILLTDTEGHDFDVLEGARERWLKDGNVGIYVFETHYGPNKRPLSDIVRELEGYGYTYIPVRSYASDVLARHVARVSPIELCWRGDFDANLRGWKNMVCTHETNFPELKFVFQELSKLSRQAGIPRCSQDKWIFTTHPWRNASWFQNKK